MMKRVFFAALVFIFVVPSATSLQATASVKNKLEIRKSMIVSTEWLARHLKDESLVLLQVGEKEEYLAGHIPGAQFITISDISTPRGEGLALELPPVSQLKATFEKLGVTDKSRIVIYFSKDWVTPTARVFFTLDYLGFGDRASILDGGLAAWRAEGKPLVTDVTEAKAGHFTPKLNSQIVVDVAWVGANLNKPGVRILDARARTFYSGEETGRMPRGGHIPSALNIPFSSLVEESNNKFKSVETLNELLDVILELQHTLGSQAEKQVSSRSEKIAALKEAFNRNVAPVEEVIRSVGGEVTGRAWINQTVRARVPAEKLRELSEQEKIAAVDVPHVLTPDSTS